MRMPPAAPPIAQLKVYTRPGCLFCGRVCELLKEGGFVFSAEEITDTAQQEELSRRYNAVSFPIVVAGSIYLGGYAHILNLASHGRLNELVNTESGPPSGRLQRSQPGTSPRPISWTSQMDALKGIVKKT